MINIAKKKSVISLGEDLKDLFIRSSFIKKPLINDKKDEVNLNIKFRLYDRANNHIEIQNIVETNENNCTNFKNNNEFLIHLSEIPKNIYCIKCFLCVDKSCNSLTKNANNHIEIYDLSLKCYSLENCTMLYEFKYKPILQSFTFVRLLDFFHLETVWEISSNGRLI